MESLRHRHHDGRLNVFPPVDDLFVADTDDVVPQKRKPSIVFDIACALWTDMMPAVNLNDQPLAQQEVNAVPREPNLLPDRHS